MAHNHDGVPGSTPGPATNFPLVFNKLYKKKDDTVVCLLDLLNKFGILRNILVDNHGFVHRVTGLHAYIEESKAK